MKKFIPFLLLPVALAIAAAVLAPKLASDERLRDEARTMILAATGREPVLGGVSFSVLPWPALDIGGLSIDDPHARLDVPVARVVLDVLPLLTGRVRADHISLTDPTLTLVDPGDPLTALGSFIAALGVADSNGEVVVTNGSLRVTRGGERDIAIPQADLTIAWRGGHSVSAVGKVMWRGEPVDIDTSLTGLSGLAAGEAGKLNVSLASGPATLSFKGGARLAGGPVVAGSLTADSPQLRGALQWLGMEAPTERGFGAFELRAQALLSAQGAMLNEARIDLDGNSGVGAFNLRIDGDRTMLQGSLASEAVDLSPYGELTFSNPRDGRWSHDDIDLSRTHALDVDLRLSARQVRIGGAELQRMAASATAKGGRLSLTIGEAEAWGGIFRASAQLAPRDAGPGVNMRMDLAGDDVALARALGELFRFPRLEGTGSFRLSAAGGGTSIMEIAQSLNGAFTLNGENGALVGIDVGRILARLEKRPLSGGGDLRGGRTPFGDIVVDASIAGGVVTLDRLDFSSDRLHVALAGESMIALRTLDLTGLAQLVRAAPAKAGQAGDAQAGTARPGLVASLSGDTGTPAAEVEAADTASAKPTEVTFELPFIVRGDWQRPIVLPDPQALIRRSGAARALLGGSEKLDVSAPAP
ncbi:AsmA family protein [Ancylobacter dichloromethanicus]|uniref:Cell envelope biogenesis protein AsmA n=1 Tax=Ancylobacter dichloromethanicus TaxID=518825 RepID=A0A9W6N0U9_9HYPH|nr:AsmA family protein [Ancylobacter dichloromethanicus]MBS7552444.1 AsmA family protein [Ancylobacter dichloromethanicus]GLK74184.1 cell envelope biogenesis protein AsmA [Ancylobacter dichloromethanicus]